MKSSHHQIHSHGFTALESLIMLTLLAVLAMTSLAVYRKQSSQAPALEIQAPASSTSVKRHNADAEPRKAMSDSQLNAPAIPTNK